MPSEPTFGTERRTMPSVLINIDVDDLERGIDFYTRAFALRVGRRLGPHIAELLGAETAVYLLEKAPGTDPYDGAARARDYARHWTPVHLDWIVDDVGEALKHVESLGAVVEAGVAEHAWGRIALFRDPFGNGFCLVEFRGRGYEEFATG
jgi:lactoylglutathione lyase